MSLAICGYKKSFRTWRFAAEAAGAFSARFPDDKIHVYHCSTCGHWHTGHNRYERNSTPEPAGLRERTARGLAKLKEMLGR